MVAHMMLDLLNKKLTVDDAQNDASTLIDDLIFGEKRSYSEEDFWSLTYT